MTFASPEASSAHASSAADAAHRQPAASERARRQAEVVAALKPHVPAHALLWNAEDTTPYECDGLTAYRQRPLVVCLPETEAQVQAVLRACHAIQVPVIARGAGTGLSGGALPHPMGVTLSLAKFNKIVKVDAASRTAVVQCGVRNLAISEAAAPFGLYYAPTPAARSPAPSAATWPRTRAACTASSTG
jgi:glycolate oxidase